MFNYCGRLVIKGSGFSSDKYAGSNVVLIGPYECNIITYQTSDTVVGALTTNMQA